MKSKIKKFNQQTKKSKSKIQEQGKITQQKGRRIALQLQTAAENETNKLLKEGHITKVKKTTIMS